jgi:tetratricopeptide (TPR) repeat protein
MSNNPAKPSKADYPVTPADLVSQQNRLRKAAAAGANALKSPALSALLKQSPPPAAMPEKPIEPRPGLTQSSQLIETAPEPEQVLPSENPVTPEVVVPPMNDNEAILAQLRMISASAEMQRKITKWMLVFLAMFIPALIGLGILLAQRASSNLEDTPPRQKSDWYEVERNVRVGDFDKAIGLGEELILKTPQYPEAHTRLAGAYLAAGKLDKAREHYAEAFRLFPCEENEKLLAAIDKRTNAEKP